MQELLWFTVNMGNVPFSPRFRSDGVGALHTGALLLALKSRRNEGIQDIPAM